MCVWGRGCSKNYVLKEIKLTDILRFRLLQLLLNISLCPFAKTQTAKQGPLIKMKKKKAVVEINYFMCNICPLPKGKGTMLKNE